MTAWHYWRSVSRMSERWSRAYDFDLSAPPTPATGRLDEAVRELTEALDDAEAFTMRSTTEPEHARVWGGCRARIRNMRQWVVENNFLATVG